jgi:hypothetical protein
MTAARALVCLVLLGLAGCLQPASTTCADGTVCPPDSICDSANHRCITKAAQNACAGLAEGDACNFVNLMGTCRSGTCQPYFCGDGVRTAGEACDGTDLAGQTCASLGYYGQTTGLACAGDCSFDTTGCSGRCGDGIVNGTEQCDGSPPPGKTCLDYGYDRGFLGCTDLCAPSFATCDTFGWQADPSQQGGTFTALWGTSSNDIFVTDGNHEEIRHWDGATWSSARNPVPNYILGIWGTAPDDVWAVGWGFILHWDGASWSVSLSVPTESVNRYELDAVWGSGPNDVFAAGGNQLLHWDGTSWSDVSLPFSDNLGAIWGSGPNDVYVVSATENGTLLHWNGIGWSTIEVTATGGTNFRSIWGSGPKDVYAVGPPGTFHWDGQKWSELPDAPPAGTFVWGKSPDDIFIVTFVRTDVGVGTSTTVNAVNHWDGQTWSQVFEGPVSAVWGDARGDTYFAGAGFFAPEAGEWVPLVTSGPELASGASGALWGTGDDVILAWDDVVGYVDGHDSFVRLPVPNGFGPSTALWGAGPNDIWGIGPGLQHWDGKSWSSQVVPLVGAQLMNIGGHASNDLWAVGNFTMHWDGHTWSTPTPFPVETLLHAVWSNAATDVYAVGVGGTIIHWDGAGWSPMSSGTSELLTDVWGTGPNDMYAVGSNGTILHLFGGKWTSLMTNTTVYLGQITGSGPGNIFVRPVVGGTTDRSLLHYRDGAWEHVALPAGISEATSIWATPRALYLLGVGANRWTQRLNFEGVDCVAPERNCNDGWDNDCDGRQDAADPDCANDKPAEQCANLVDDDANGLVDCADPACAQFPSCKGKR